MDRVLQNTSATISATFTVDRTATDPTPDSADVEVLREDGTTLIDTTAATNQAGGRFDYTLTASHTALLDVLTARWTATIGGQAQTLETHAEIVGGFVCSLAQIDAELGKATDDAVATYGLETVRAARDAATEALETGQVFTPRYRRLTLDGDGSSDVLLPFRPLSVTSATVDDTALTAGELAALKLYDSGLLYNPAGWAPGRSNVELKITYGHRYPPADVSRAVAVLAAHLLKDGPFDDRGYGVTEDGGGVRLLTAGVQGAMFSIPECEAVARRYRVPVVA